MYFFRPIIPVNTFACRCPPGFTGMRHKYECDTEVNLCYSSPCLEGGTCRRREGGYTCLCKEGFTGIQCEINLSNSSCSLGNCSQCVDSRNPVNPRDFWNSKICELQARSFSKGTYMTFPTLRQRNRFSLSITFATQQRNALLLYNGRYNDKHDFVALEIINGQLLFSFSLGGYVAKVSVTLSNSVNDGQWHTAHIDYFNRTATLSVNDCDIGMSLKFGNILGNYHCANSTSMLLEERCADIVETCYRYLDLTGPLHLGGLPALVNDLQVKSTHFSGCIKDFSIDHQIVNLDNYVSNNGATRGCPQKMGFCSTSPCKNGGTCIDGWESYTCICSPGYVSKDCNETVDVGKSFLGDGFIVFIPNLHPIQLPWTQRASFRTHHDHGLLLQIKLGLNSLVVIEIADGYLRYVFNKQQLVLPDVLVNDGKWHNVEASWYPNWLHISLDYGQYEVKKVVKASIRGMYISKVSVGGVESSDDDGRITFFVGCMQNVKIGSSHGSWLRPIVEVNVREGCLAPSHCSSNPCPPRSACIEHWGNYSCQCHEGFVGEDCLPVCHYNPCSELSVCETKSSWNKGEKTYACKCDAQHTGEYCETLLDLPCPSNWWGYPICGPCQCDPNKGYSANCNKTTGQCICQENYFLPPESDVCYPCDCYSIGSYGNDCNSVTGQCKCRPGVIGRRCDSCSNPLSEVTLRGCEVIYDSCPRSYSNGIWWQRTLFESFAKQNCPDGSFGQAYRYCSEDDGWEVPDLFGCTTPAFHKLAEQLENIERGVTELNTSVAIEMVSNLRTAANKTFPLYGNDILVFNVVMNRVIEHEQRKTGLDLSHRQDKDFIQNMIQATNSVLSPKYISHWNQIASTTGKGVEKVLEVYEDYLNLLMNNFVDTFTRPFELVEKNIVFGVDTVSLDDLWEFQDGNRNETDFVEISPYVDYTLSDEEGVPSIVFPKFNNYPMNNDFGNHLVEAIIPLSVAGIKEQNGLHKEKKGNKETAKEIAVVGYVIYSTLGQLLPPMFGESIRYQGIPLYVNSPILTVIIQPVNSSGVERKLDKVRLKFQVYNSEGTSPQCAYWNFGNKNGFWSSEGCQVEYYEPGSSHINCTCSHLSSFTVLMEKNHKEFIPTETLAQNVISYIAIVISLLLLATTFIIFCLLRGSQTNSNTIHICLIVSIFLGQLIFLIALKTRHTLVFQQFPCKMVAILLHFLFLSIFSWLFVEAVHILRMMTNFCDINHGPMHCYFFIGFGGPALIVGLSVGVSVDQYGNHFFCWLSVHESVVWSLVGPVCVIVVITLGVFVSAFKASMQSKDVIMDFGGLKTLLWLAVMLLPIQGSTWVLAILSVNESHAILQYAFSFFCLLEGVYIFVGYCVINKKVQQQLYSTWLCLSKPKNQTKKKGIVHTSTSIPTSKMYERSVGTSMSSATRTCSTNGKVESEPQPSTSELNTSINSSHPILLKRENIRSSKSHYDDILNGNHVEYSSGSKSFLENNEENSSVEIKMTDSPPGPKMGINVFSHGSRSPLNRPSISLKSGHHSKDDWFPSAACQKSSPISTPKMGISFVEMSARYRPESTSLDNRTCSKPDFRTGICSFCRSQASLKDSLNSSENSNIHDQEKCSVRDKKCSFSKTEGRQRCSKFELEHSRSLSDASAIKPRSPLTRTLSSDHFKSNVRLKDTKSSDTFLQTSAPSDLSSNDNDAYFDRSSPKLIDDSPSEEDSHLSMSFMKVEYSPSNESSNSFKPRRPQPATIPPLATAELSDSDYSNKKERVV